MVKLAVQVDKAGGFSSPEQSGGFAPYGKSLSPNLVNIVRSVF